MANLPWPDLNSRCTCIWFRSDHIFECYTWSHTKLFLQSSELGLLQPLTRRRVCPPPPFRGWKGTLSGKTGGGRLPIPTRDIHCGTLYFYKYILCVLTTQIDLIHSARSHPHSAISNLHSARSHPHSARSHPHTLNVLTEKLKDGMSSWLNF